MPHNVFKFLQRPNIFRLNYIICVRRHARMVNMRVNILSSSYQRFQHLLRGWSFQPGLSNYVSASLCNQPKNNSKCTPHKYGETFKEWIMYYTIYIWKLPFGLALETVDTYNRIWVVSILGYVELIGH